MPNALAKLQLGIPVRDQAPIPGLGPGEVLFSTLAAFDGFGAQRLS